MQGHFALDVQDVAGCLGGCGGWLLGYVEGGVGVRAGAYCCDVVDGTCFVGGYGFGAGELHLQRRVSRGGFLRGRIWEGVKTRNR